MSDLRIGVLGAGYFAQFHIEAWQRLDGCELVGVADSDPAKGADFETLDALITAETLDIIDIATPPPSHAGAIRRAIAAKPSAIICQKPFCTSLAEATQVVRDAEMAGIPLIIHENFRFQPWFRAMKAALEDGRIGEVHQISFRLRPGDGQGPRAYLDRQPYFQTMERLLIHETAVHFIDVFCFLLGKPQAAYADLRKLNPVIKGEDAGYFILDFADGKRALFDGNRHLDHVAENTRLTMGEAHIEGSGGTLTLYGDGGLYLRKFGDQSAETLLPAQDWPGFAGDCVANLCAHVRDHLTQDRALENTARDYLAILAIEEALYQSAKEGRKLDL